MLGRGKPTTTDPQRRGSGVEIMGETGSVTLKGARGTSNRYLPPPNAEVIGSRSRIKQKKALTTHHNVSHLHKRDFWCTHEGCNKSYGYKHLLQRHLSRAHREVESSNHSGGSEDGSVKDARMDIDGITGRSYLERNCKIKRPVCCPHPSLPSQFTSDRDPDLSVSGSVAPCEHVFGRAYDLRRHLLSVHGLVVEKDVVGAWVEERRTGESIPASVSA